MRKLLPQGWNIGDQVPSTISKWSREQILHLHHDQKAKKKSVEFARIKEKRNVQHNYVCSEYIQTFSVANHLRDLDGIWQSLRRDSPVRLLNRKRKCVCNLAAIIVENRMGESSSRLIAFPFTLRPVRKSITSDPNYGLNLRAVWALQPWIINSLREG